MGNRSYQATLDAKETHPIQYGLLKELESGRPSEKLYDMQNNPGQLVNLVGKKEYIEKQEELRNALSKWRAKTGDLVDDPLHIKTRQLEN